MATTATDHLAKYHHPHFASAEPGQVAGQWEFTFLEFSGQEQRPELVGAFWDDNLSEEDRDLLREEYRRAQELWGTARFQDKGRSQVRKMSSLWPAYRQAVADMTAAFYNLESTPSTGWRAQVMKVTRLHDAALKAAQAWDVAGANLAEAYAEYQQAVGPHTSIRLKELISQFGINTKDWEVYRKYDYDPDSAPCSPRSFLTPTVKKVTDQIEEHEERIRRVAELTGDC
ncbi:hypothetical protein [Streptomyces ipomoeae]|uniref:hypothetical protein n=1 Tax=Streptomyces ipomoeae TaxID=103232 RepID=UPI0011477979|nr:hypothetical protein [Streptomyces ipomoeae]TQE33155.1 hypothetical protein Sipo7851_21935 [Streptomyces ipomoeae]